MTTPPLAPNNVPIIVSIWPPVLNLPRVSLTDWTERFTLSPRLKITAAVVAILSLFALSIVFNLT